MREPSTDLVRRDGDLPAIADVADQLDCFERGGQTEKLNEVASQALAYQRYAERNKATERAAYFGRIKLMAEARIGSVDIALHPLQSTTPLELDGEAIPKTKRTAWRLLAMGLRIGQLDKAMDSVFEKHESIATHTVVAYLRDRGAVYVDASPLLTAYRRRYESEGLTMAEVHRAIGVSNTPWLAKPGREPHTRRTHRLIAERAAAFLGVDASKLRGMGGIRRPRRRRRKARPLPGGRLDETYVLIRKALSELDRAIGTTSRWDAAPAFDHLYEAETIIGKALKRAAE